MSAWRFDILKQLPKQPLVQDADGKLNLRCGASRWLSIQLANQDGGMPLHYRQPSRVVRGGRPPGTQFLVTPGVAGIDSLPMRGDEAGLDGSFFDVEVSVSPPQLVQHPLVQEGGVCCTSCLCRFGIGLCNLRKFKKANKTGEFLHNLRKTCASAPQTSF
jgi:hypothetical protein